MPANLHFYFMIILLGLYLLVAGLTLVFCYFLLEMVLERPTRKPILRQIPSVVVISPSETTSTPLA